jgi:hypothetical protein
MLTDHWSDSHPRGDESVQRLHGAKDEIAPIGQQWDGLATARGNGALPTAFFLGQRYAGLRFKANRENQPAPLSPQQSVD